MSRLVLEIEREKDGRWIAEVMNVSGAMAYGKTLRGAVSAAVAIAAKRIVHGP